MTPIETLIEKLESFRKELDEKYDGDPLVKRGITIAISEARSLLPQEREAIEDAYAEGHARFTECGEFELEEKASDYFTEKYGK